MNLPTSFVLPPEAVDRLRAAAKNDHPFIARVSAAAEGCRREAHHRAGACCGKGCPMSSTLIAVLVFVFVFGGALAGVAIRVPAHHQDAETKDVVKLVMGLVATIAALVLSLLIASAHSSYDTQESEVQQLGAQLVQLDEVFAHYGPETNDARAQLRRMVKAEARAAVARCRRRTSSHAHAAKLRPGGRPVRHRHPPDAQFRRPAICPGARSAAHDDHGHDHPPAAPAGRRLPVLALLRRAGVLARCRSSPASVSMRAATPPSLRRCSSAR